MQSSQAEILSKQVHPNAEIHAFAVIEADVIVEEAAIIRPHVVLRARCRIGSRAIIGEGTVVFEGISVGEDANLAPFSIVKQNVPPGISQGISVQGNPVRTLNFLTTIPNVLIHPQALVESTQIGEGTRIWAFCHILPGAKIGWDVNLCDHTFIENDVLIGDRVTVKCGVQLWDGLRIEDDVFIGPNVTFTNDRFPRSKHYPEHFLETRICRGASIGANATILPGITIGEFAMIGAGAVVIKDIPAFSVAVGNPARVIRQLESVDASTIQN